MPARAVLLSACASVGPQLDRQVHALAQQHDEVVVAIDGPLHASLPSRWAAVRAQVTHARAWCTPVTHSTSLPSRLHRLLALTSRLGVFHHLWVDDPGLVDDAKMLNLTVEHGTLAGGAPSVIAERTRALVVLRAQPFHRGHLALIQHGLSLADEVVVVIAAAERSYAARDPFTAGERLALVRAGLGALTTRCWLVALPAPAWPASALAELTFVAPPYDVVVTHNPILAAMAAQHGKRTARLPEPVRVANDLLSASAIRARLAREGAGKWLEAVVPQACVPLLLQAPLAERCEVIATGG